MREVKRVLKATKEGILVELKNLKKLEGDKFKKMSEVFGFDEDTEIFYNDFNVVITDLDSFSQLSPYLQEKNMILTIQFDEYNAHLFVYKYYNDNLLDSYLTDSDGSR